MSATEDGKSQKAVKSRSIPGDSLCQNIPSLLDWLEEKEKEPDPEGCIPCDLATIAPWYRDLLKEKGYPELAARVNALAEGEHTSTEIARVLDEVKEAVKDEETGLELLAYDCMMQKYKEEEA
jgi:hypothetical protein